MSTRTSKQPSSRARAKDLDFVQTLGPAFFAHLLRRISDQLVEADQQWHEEAGISNPPRTSSTLLALDQNGAMSVTELAVLLCQSHQLVMQWIRALQVQGMVETKRDPDDGRRSIVLLTNAGRDHIPILRRTIERVEIATRSLLDEVAPGIDDPLWAVAQTLAADPFIHRIRRADPE